MEELMIAKEQQLIENLLNCEDLKRDNYGPYGALINYLREAKYIYDPSSFYKFYLNLTKKVFFDNLTNENKNSLAFMLRCVLKKTCDPHEFVFKYASVFWEKNSVQVGLSIL